MNIPPMQPRADEYPSLQRARDADLRDTFAASALTGLLAQGDDGSFSEESYARAAFHWADVMLRERERNGASEGCETVRLTDAEREAVEWCISRPQTHWQHGIYAATLRGLLERTK